MYTSKTFDAKLSENFNSFVSRNAVKRKQTDSTTTTVNELKSIELIRSAFGAIQPHNIHSNTIFNTAVVRSSHPTEVRVVPYIPKNEYSSLGAKKLRTL